jgi:hypothetical protein
LEMRGEWNHQRIVAERNRKKAEKLAIKAAAAARAKARYEEQRAAREAEKAAREAEALARKAEVEAFRASEQAKRDAEREQKRAEREAAQAQRDAARERAEERARIAKLLANTVKGIEQSMYGSCFKATKFKSLDEAAVAAEKYTAAKGYDFEGFLCENCKSFHIRADEVKFEAKRQAAKEKAEPRPTYAEVRAAQASHISV